jgi:SAM-dependent methyltransferase
MEKYRQKAFLHYEKILTKIQSRSEKDIRINFALFKRNLGPHLPKDKQAAILELGSGFGDVLAYLAEQGYRDVRGVDLSPWNVDNMRKRGLQAEQGDCTEFLRGQQRKFDIIILYDVLEHHLKDEALNLMELVCESLKPGGKALIVVPNMGNPFTASRGRYVDITHEVGYGQESMNFLLELAGFTNIRILSIDHFVLPNPLFNLAGKTVLYLVYACMRVLYLLHGITSTTVYGKNILSVATKD